MGLTNVYGTMPVSNLNSEIPQFSFHSLPAARRPAPDYYLVCGKYQSERDTALIS